MESCHICWTVLKKIQIENTVSVLPNGVETDRTDHYSGSTADITIFRANPALHKEALRKTQAEIDDVQDFGPLDHNYSNSCVVLGQKGYQGAVDFTKGLYNKNKALRGFLSAEDQWFNSKGLYNRVVLEKYFGLLCTLRTIMGSKYRWAESSYD